MNYQLIPKSGNTKTGPIPVSISSAKTCPPSCAFNGNGCYAQFFPGKLHWDKVTNGDAGMPWTEFLEQIEKIPEGQLWRHNQSGDLAGFGDRIDPSKLIQLTRANEGRKGFTYTHKPVLGIGNASNRSSVRYANRYGFAVNLSANDPKQADAMMNLAIAPVVVVMPEGQTENMVTPQGRKILVCPAYTKPGKNCGNCGLCYKRPLGLIIGFPAHGQAWRRINAHLGIERKNGIREKPLKFITRESLSRKECLNFVTAAPIDIRYFYMGVLYRYLGFAGFARTSINQISRDLKQNRQKIRNALVLIGEHNFYGGRTGRPRKVRDGG